ncbi:DUF4129 domain-containing transglutaminase family protein [Brevibacillus ginsengisoli]|uniref:DUF4129 domain-containing transglutaminase family protein n=1 Tax=Brevibacillus ginsengisoli TaxID=363854 RepID=UPI003CF11AAA
MIGTLQFFRRVKVMDWLAAIFLFLLLREWLLPLPILTDTSEATPFLLLTAGVLLIDMLFEWRWLGFLLKMGFGLWMLHQTFFETSFFKMEWLRETYERLIHDIPLLYSQQWLAMSPVTRSLLFYLLLLVLISILSYLVLQQRQGLWFVFMTEAYLATLDTFMPYDADAGIIRSLIVGFIMLAVLHFSAMEKLAGPGQSKLTYWKSLIAPLLIISFTVGVAYSAPKADASWPDPISYFTSQANDGKGTLKKVGYDNNDTTLGGPFIQDESLVFMAETNEKYYWRGDSKDIYTGKGWKKGEVEYESILNPGTYEWRDKLFENVETKKVDARLRFTNGEQYPTIFYPGQLLRTTSLTPQNATIQYDVTNKHIQTHEGVVSVTQSSNPASSAFPKTVEIPNPTQLKMLNYEEQAEVPVLSEKKMLELPSRYPSSIKEHYLQLPENLPPRIKELALKVTESAKTPYEKAVAIETFLRSGDYKYEIRDVPVPTEGQDFVDQFLFETKRGYCDHFSSSMVVMLRTIGIPARWVKGFAPGTEVGQIEDGRKLIEVRNKDAHSWAEVYFPEVGWIPFEATTSFVSPVRVNYDLNSAPEQQPAVNNTQANKPQEQNKDRLNKLEEDENTATGGKKVTGKYAWILGVILLAGSVIAWKRRNQLLVWWIRKQIATYSEDRFVEKYGKLLALYERVLMNRREGETLREYVRRLSVPGDVRQDLWYLTNLYEQIHYGYKELEEKSRTIANKIMDRLSQQMKP